jgi:hypothetical protein
MEGRIGEWLQRAGLGRFRPNFYGMNEPTFLNLLMQDYGKYGLSDMNDKHALFSLIKEVRAQLGLSEQTAADCAGPGRAGGFSHLELQGPGEQLHGHADLLDLDAHDGDLLEVGCIWDNLHLL